MKTIFLFIPHYVFTSDLLRTNFIKSLSEKYRVVIFGPVASGDYYRSPNIEYIRYESEYPNFWLVFSKTLRLGLIREFDGLEYMKLRRRLNINMNWQRRLMRAIGRLLPRPLLTARFFTKLETWLLPNSKKFRGYVQKYRPSVLLTCTPGFNNLEAEAIILAKKNAIPTAAIDSSWDNYTSNSLQFRYTDYLICWNEIMKKEAIALHKYPETNVFVSGTYRFDHHFQPHPKGPGRDEFLRSKGLDPKLKTLWLCTVPPNTYPPQYNVWKEILAMRDRGEFGQDVNIFFRIHPNDERERYAEYKGMKNVHVELAGHQKERAQGSGQKIEMNESDLDNLRHSLRYTDININFRSSLGLESVIYDQPVINLALGDYERHYYIDHYIPVVNSGGVAIVKTPEELRMAINAYLEDPALHQEGRKKMFQNYVGFADGQSYQRSVLAIDRILSEVVQS